MTKYPFDNPPWKSGPKFSDFDLGVTDSVALYPQEKEPVVDPKRLQRAIEATPNLNRASLENALLFGGPLVRQLLAKCPLVGDRPSTIVDTKITLLLPGFIPAIPGWHTDGVPRGSYNNPYDTGKPSMDAQMVQAEKGEFPRFHTIIVGNPCVTQFVDVAVNLDLRHANDTDLYKEVSLMINEGGYPTRDHPVNEWISWSWWNIHRAVPATERGWRLQMRVAEMYHPPLPTNFIRAQNQVYIGGNEFGW